LRVNLLLGDAEDAGNLAWAHNNPFDRLLVAQPMRLAFGLLTADRSIRAFPGVAHLPATQNQA
jgi:PIN domain nuclease of toxin-antitoxin system